jgi:hypothetical protein
LKTPELRFEATSERNEPLRFGATHTLAALAEGGLYFVSSRGRGNFILYGTPGCRPFECGLRKIFELVYPPEVLFPDLHKQEQKRYDYKKHPAKETAMSSAQLADLEKLDEKFKKCYLESDLYKERTPRASIALDGIVDPGSFGKNKDGEDVKKILWILQEPDAPGEAKPWSLNNLILGMGNPKKDYHAYRRNFKSTFFRPYEVSYGIIYKKDWNEVYKTPEEDIVQIRKHIAWINAKKVCGGPSVNPKLVLKFYSLARKLIMDQIALINPDIIINCVSKIKGQTISGDLKEAGFKYIDSRHPSRAGKEKFFNNIIEKV